MALSYRGVAQAALSACCFATLSIFIRFAYDAGATTATILGFRFFLAAILLWGAVIATGKLPLVRRRDWLPLSLLGTLGYGLMSACFAQSVHYLSASLAALLLYLYPSIVTLLSFWLGHVRYSHDKVLALLLSLAGLLLTIGMQGDFSWTGVGFGLGAAVIYSLYLLCSAQVLKNIDPLISTAVICTAAAISYLLYGAASGSLQFALPLTAWLAISGMAIVPTFAAMLLLFSAMRAIGAARTSVVSTLEPLATVILSMLFLAETLLPLQFVGGGLILAGILLLELRSAAETN